MRVDVYPLIQERRNAIDQRWFDFLEKCHLLPILLPNTTHYLSYINAFQLDGLVLTGGNSLGTLGGDALERDAFETKLIELMIEAQKPVLGVCRGMQVIQDYFGVRLGEVSRHVATRHKIEWRGDKIEVNSYHEYGANDTTDDLEVLAYSEDGVVEAIAHKSLPILGIMWHPEREQKFSDFDLTLFQKHFLS